MAIIPKAKGQGLVSTEVSRRPTQSIESAGIVGRGMQSFAKGLGDVGQVFAQVDAQQAKIEADSMSQKLVNDAIVEATQMEQSLKQETEGNHAEYSKEYSKRLNFLKESVTKRKDISDLTKKLFTNRFGNVERRLQVGALKYQTEQRTKFNYNLDQQNVTSKANTLSVMPDPTEALKGMTETEATFKNPSKYQGDQAIQGVKQGRNAIFDGLMAGYENTDNPEAALEILNKKLKGYEGILDGIDENKVQTWRRRFENLSKINTTVNKKLLNDQFKNTEAAIMDRFEPVDNNSLNVLQQTFVAQGDMDRAQSVEMLRSANSLMQEFKKKSNSDIDKALRQIKNKGVQNLPEFKVKGTMNAAEKVRLADRLTASLENLKQFREARGADFIRDNFTDVQNLAAQASDIDNPSAMQQYAAKTLEYQKAQGIKNTKILTDDLANTYASQINITKNPEINAQTAAANITKLKQGFGDNASSIARELVDRELITPEQAYAFHFDDPKSINSLMELQNPEFMKSVNDSYKKIEGVDPKGEMASINDDKTYQDFKRAIVQVTGKDDNLQVANTVRTIMEKDYKRLRATSDLTSEQARERVIKKYMDNWKITANDTPVVIPTVEIKRNGYNVDRIEDNVNELRSAMPFIQESLNIPIPDAYKKDLGQDAPEKWKKDLRNKARWVTSPEMDGVILMLDMGAEKPVAVPADDKGGLVKVTYKELNQGFDLSKGQKPEGVIGAVYKHRQRFKLDKPFIRTAEIGRQF
jgi:hypothetical protein